MHSLANSAVPDNMLLPSGFAKSGLANAVKEAIAHRLAVRIRDERPSLTEGETKALDSFVTD